MLEGHFIPSAEGCLFVTQFGEISSDTAILCLPSITEELNLSRAVVAKQAQLFAKNNLPCFVLDYYGTGDSEGEFEQANGDIWLDNILDIGQWLTEQGIEKIILFGVRFGSLLILAHQNKLHQALPIVKQILWKPVTSGKQFAGQFIRIKQANSMMNKSSERINWRAQVLEGNDTEIAGYLLTKKMLLSMEALQLCKTFQPKSELHWFDLSSKEPTPLAQRLVSQWSENKAIIHCFDCPSFWQVPEVFSLPELEQLTLDVAMDKGPL